MQAKRIQFFLCAQCCAKPVGLVNDKDVNVTHTHI